MSEQLAEAKLKQLLDAVSRHDETAMAEFYDLTSGKVFGLVRYMLKNPELAEEVTLDTFLQVWQDAGNYREDKARPLTWLLMIARSRAIDRLRSLKNTAGTVDIEDVADELADPAENPEASAVAAERSRLVRACLARLPQLERQKLTLAFFNGLSQGEIAAYCRMPLGTVKTYIRNGMARLGKLLEEHAGFEL